MKRAYNIEKQIQSMKNNGVTFDNINKAKEILLDIGFYRIGFYSFPFEKSFPRLENRNHKMKTGTSFKSIYDLYYFDTCLRKILLSILDRIEVNIRTQISYIVSNHYIEDPYWFANINIMEDNYVYNFEERVYRTLRDNPVIKRHHKNHGMDTYAPAWKTIEFMTLGNISSLYKALKDDSIKRLIAKQYGCSMKVFINYLETIRVIRNKCAHGNCIYNVELAKGIAAKPAGVSPDCRHNINGAICVLKHFIGCISQNRRIELEQNIYSLLNSDREANTNEIIKNCTKLAF